MAEYKVEVDLSDLFDDMTINEQKNFLVEKFSSLPCHKTDYKPNLMDKRKFMAELRRDSNIMIKTF